MQRPVIAYHLVLTCYGFWLPNDPRGSWSSFVRSFEIYSAGGPATKVAARRSVARQAHDGDVRRAGKRALARPAVVWNGQQAREVARAFGDYVSTNRRRVVAAAVMPDHAHLVVERSGVSIETVAEQLKARASAFLRRAGLHPFQGDGRLPTPWARHSWSVFLDRPESVRRAIDYVEANPVRAGYRRQRYAWVRRYEP